jgi:hypothetical protein
VKRARIVLAGVVGGVALVATLTVVLVVSSLTRAGSAPEVASLGTGDMLKADLVLPEADGYVVAGVAGTEEPGADGLCSGRFAVVSLDDVGSPRRALLASGPERDRYCANWLESAFRGDDGGWVLSGAGLRDAGRSPIRPSERSHDIEMFTLRLSDDGEADSSFGDGGLLRGALVVGRSDDVLVTNRLRRVSADGELRDDLLVSRGPELATWYEVLHEQDLLVAFSTGSSLRFQPLLADRTRDPVQFQPLAEADVEIGDVVLSSGDLALDSGRLYAVASGERAHVVAVDPVQGHPVPSFGTAGRASLDVPELVTSAALAVGARGLVVVFTTLDHVHGYRLHARRFSADGLPDASYGGLLLDRGKGLAGDLHVASIAVDSKGRAVVMSALDSVLLRLTPRGRLDTSFGRNGIVSTTFAVCGLPPASAHAGCG